MRGRVRTDYPLTFKAARTAVGYVGRILGHQREILWECPPRHDGRDDPRLPAHHQPHRNQKDARECAQAVFGRGLDEGWWA